MDRENASPAENQSGLQRGRAITIHLDRVENLRSATDLIIRGAGIGWLAQRGCFQ